MPMIIEGILTTQNADGTANVAPMGPIVSPDWTEFVFRPFPSSITYGNLKRAGGGVFHVTDDVDLIVHAALDLPYPAPRLHPATTVAGHVLSDACRWYEVEIGQIDESGERPRMTARTVATGRQRDFLGFNRARHAILEATILATRLHLVTRAEIERQFAMFAVIVDKTASPEDAAVFRLIQHHVARHLPSELVEG